MDEGAMSGARLWWPRGEVVKRAGAVPRMVTCTQTLPSCTLREAVKRCRAPWPVCPAARAVRHVRRRLPEVAGPDVMLDAVLDADPFALEADAPLLVGMRVHRGDRAGSDLDDGEHQVLAREHASRQPVGQLTRDAATLQVVEVLAVGHG